VTRRCSPAAASSSAVGLGPTASRWWAGPSA
jgi:hypothetical protein